jgi:hypothetical protein
MLRLLSAAGRHGVDRYGSIQIPSIGPERARSGTLNNISSFSSCVKHFVKNLFICIFRDLPGKEENAIADTLKPANKSQALLCSRFSIYLFTIYSRQKDWRNKPAYLCHEN